MAEEKQKKIQAWGDFTKDVEVRRDQKLEELGLKPAIKLADGDNDLVIDTRAGVRKIDTQYGERYVMDLAGDHKGKCLMCSPYLADLVTRNITEEDPKIIIVRSNEEGKTRYKVKTDGEIKKDGDSKETPKKG